VDVDAIETQIFKFKIVFAQTGLPPHA